MKVVVIVAVVGVEWTKVVMDLEFFTTKIQKKSIVKSEYSITKINYRPEGIVNTTPLEYFQTKKKRKGEIFHFNNRL